MFTQVLTINSNVELASTGYDGQHNMGSNNSEVAILHYWLLSSAASTHGGQSTYVQENGLGISSAGYLITRMSMISSKCKHF